MAIRRHKSGQAYYSEFLNAYANFAVVRNNKPPPIWGTLEKNNGTISPCNMPKNALGLGLDGGFFSRISRQIEV